MKNYIPFKLVTWDDYDEEIERAKKHLEEHGFLLWRLGVNIEHPLIAVKRSGSKEIVAIMVSEGCIKKKELMQMIEKKGNNWYFKESEYEGEPIMPQEWIGEDLENRDDETWYLIVTEIINDVRIDESAIYAIDKKSTSLKLNNNWNQGAEVYLRICG